MSDVSTKIKPEAFINPQQTGEVGKKEMKKLFFLNWKSDWPQSRL